MRESICDDVVPAVDVDAVEIRRGWDGVVVAAWEGPVAPLLSVYGNKSQHLSRV